MKNKISNTLTILILCGVVSASIAQDNGLPLKEITVTSSLISTDVSRTGRNIITFKGEDFAKLPVNSIDELLRYVPGVEVQARGPMGSQSDFVLRGGTFQQVLVILDGMRINDPNSGHFTSYIPITPAQIERIEVLKGASSAIYGSDAVGGVINIITKAFSARQHAAKEISGQVTTGAYGLINANAGGLYTAGRTTFDGGLLSNNAAGQQQRGTKGFFHNNTFSASGLHHFSDKWQLGLRVSYDSRNFSAQNFYTTFLSDTAKEKVTTGWTQLRLSYRGARDKFTFSSAYKIVNDTYQFSDVSTANKSTSQLFQNLATYERSLSKHTVMIGGLQVQNKRISSNDRGDHTIQEGAVFAMVRQTIDSNLTVTPSVRVDWDSRSGTELVPQVNISYAAGDLQIRGSAGKTIRQADFTERYNNFNQPLVTSGRIGNPALLAERSFSYEAGADFWLMESSLKLSGTLFQQRFSKLIDYVTTPYSEMPRQSNLSPTGTYSLAKNISDVTTSGAETDIFYRRQLNSNTSVFSSVGLIWLNSTSPGGTPSLYLSNHAKFLTNFTAGMQTRRFAASITGIYKMRATQDASAIMTQLTPHYFVVNIKAEAFIIPSSLSAFVQVDNIGNVRYSDVLGAQMPGRWNMIGVKFRVQ